MVVGHEQESACCGGWPLLVNNSSRRAEAGKYQGVVHPSLHTEFQAKYKHKQTFHYQVHFSVIDTQNEHVIIAVCRF